MKGKHGDPDDLKVCNCADCGELLLSPTEENLKVYNDLKDRDRRRVPYKVIAGRIAQRPYCKGCFTAAKLGGRQEDRDRTAAPEKPRGGLTARQAVKKLG